MISLSPSSRFIKQDHTAIARFQTSRIICMEIFKEFPAMARFTLRDEGTVQYYCCVQ